MTGSSKQSLFNSLRFRYGLALAVFLGVALYLLWDEHKAHILGYGPLLLIMLVCCGMHFFHHGHHGGSHRTAHSNDSDSDKGEMS